MCYSVAIYSSSSTSSSMRKKCFYLALEEVMVGRDATCFFPSPPILPPVLERNISHPSPPILPPARDRNVSRPSPPILLPALPVDVLQIGLLWSSDLPSTTVLKGLFLSAWCSTPLSLKLPTQLLIVSRWYPQWTPYPPTHFTFNSSLFHAVRFFTEKSITGGHVTMIANITLDTLFSNSFHSFTFNLSFFHAARFCTEKFRDRRTRYNDRPSVSLGLLLADAV